MTELEKQQHREFLRQAIALARENVLSGKGGPFGALIVKDGEVIARAGNEVLSSKDPTMHAEVNAIRQACQKIGTFELTGCTIYSSCEPCPMCLGAIYWARPKSLFFAADRKCASRYGFDDDLIYQEMALSVGQRKIPTVYMPLDEAENPFQEWDQKADKILY